MKSLAESIAEMMDGLIALSLKCHMQAYELLIAFPDENTHINFGTS